MDGLAPIDQGKHLLADSVFRYLGAAIIDGTLREGERIRDSELAEQLNVSRMPIREALQRLERIGLVEMMPSRYTRVTTVTDDVVRASLAYAGYKAGIELRATVPGMTDAQRARTLELLDELEEAIGDDVATAARRVAFSRHVASLVPETMFSLYLHDLDIALERNLARVGSALDEDALRRNYGRMRDAIVARDGDAAERLIREQFGT